MRLSMPVVACRSPRFTLGMRFGCRVDPPTPRLALGALFDTNPYLVLPREIPNISAISRNCKMLYISQKNEDKEILSLPLNTLDTLEAICCW